jgi:adenosylcobinamide-GDP ribazoletransferase
MRPLLSAVGLLTILPVAGSRLDRRSAGAMMLWAPVAVAPVAVVVALITLGAHRLHAPAQLAGLIGFAVLAFGTRAFHLDGLADTVDAFGSGWNRDRALSIMRSGDVGPMGAIALIIVIGLQAYAFGRLATGPMGAVAVAVIICLSRTALAVCCVRRVPPARPDGLGASVAGSVPVPAAVIIGLISVALLTILGMARHGPIGGVLTGVLAGVAGYAGCVLVIRHAVTRFGGVTGDVMGAAVEITATIMAVGMVLRY